MFSFPLAENMVVKQHQDIKDLLIQSDQGCSVKTK